jgi:hypothetical protein
MISNSLPLTTSLFGNSSGLTKETVNSIISNTTDNLIQQQKIMKLNVKLPKVPSNQRIAKE